MYFRPRLSRASDTYTILPLLEAKRYTLVVITAPWVEESIRTATSCGMVSYDSFRGNFQQRIPCLVIGRILNTDDEAKDYLVVVDSEVAKLAIRTSGAEELCVETDDDIDMFYDLPRIYGFGPLYLKAMGALLKVYEQSIREGHCLQKLLQWCQCAYQARDNLKRRRLSRR